MTKGTHPHNHFSIIKGKTLMKFYLLRSVSVAESVMLIIQGAGVASKQGFTGQLGMSSFSNCLW